MKENVNSARGKLKQHMTWLALAVGVMGLTLFIIGVVMIHKKRMRNKAAKENVV